MSFIHFSKEQLNDREFSLDRELILANAAGACFSTSLINCNTRKYHGLFSVYQPQIDDNRYVLLSALDETILQDGKKIRLATHQYPNAYFPEGYQYFEGFSYDLCPRWVIKADDILLVKELLLSKEEERLLIRYTVKESKGLFLMRFDPLLAFRNVHSLSKYNIDAAKKSVEIECGESFSMYPVFSELFLQFSKKATFIHAPDWNYSMEYFQEQERGYVYNEDLYSPGYFSISLKKGDQLVFSAGLDEISPRKLKTVFETQLKSKASLTNFRNCLRNSARQFIINKKQGPELIAGYHWFGQWGRDTFIALPGLTLSTGNPESCKLIFQQMLKNLKGGLFPNTGSGEYAMYNSADASLWFFWALQQYALYTGTVSEIWMEYGSYMRAILEKYRDGTLHHIHMEDSGLLFAGESGVALTWMDAVVDGVPVTPRTGFVVELNALWYNAICFALEAADFVDDEQFITEWELIPIKLKSSFTATFWDEDKGYLADCVFENKSDWSLRPNQIFAASLPYSPIEEKIQKSLLEIVRLKLLTPRGIRTLAPDDEKYKGVYSGNQKERDLAYHQGTVWPWLLGHFVEAYLKSFGDPVIPFVQSIYENFAPAVFEYGIGTIAEIYDGDAPHKARGAVSQAWSVAELLRIRNLITVNHRGVINRINRVGTLQTV
jgi:predicted glycogen debranching enzyme